MHRNSFNVCKKTVRSVKRQPAQRHALRIAPAYQILARTRRANAAGQSIDTLPLPIRKAACLIRPYPSNVQKRARRMQRRKRNRSVQSYPRRNSKRHPVFEWTAIPVHDLDWHKHSHRADNPYDRRLPINASPANVTISKKGMLPAGNIPCHAFDA